MVLVPPFDNTLDVSKNFSRKNHKIERKLILFMFRMNNLIMMNLGSQKALIIINYADYFILIYLLDNRQEVQKCEATERLGPMINDFRTLCYSHRIIRIFFELTK